MKRYVEIHYSEFNNLMTDMKFVEVQIEGTFEKVWEFEISKRYNIRIYSTISVHDNISRSSGKDAIRCLVYDKEAKKILKLEKRVHRTSSALVNTRERCREIFKYVRDNKCSCGGIMLERKNANKHAFMGCSNFPICKNTKNIVVPQLKLKLKS